MQIVTSIVIQSLLLFLALVVTLLRYWVRLGIEKRRLTFPDYLVWGGWLFTLGWYICSIVALNIQIDHPLMDPDLTTDSVHYLVTVYVASLFFDIGLFFPKTALVAFYWWLIPYGFRRLRLAVYAGTAFLFLSFIGTMLTDFLICIPITDNWSIENQLKSLWNTYNALAINWSLNWSTDLLLFILPFFIINCLKLRKRQKVALCGVFSLGLFTIAISLARFLAYTIESGYNLDDASGNLWCTAEMCIGTIVVSLPTLKVLIMRASPTPTNRSNNTSQKHVETVGSGRPGAQRKSFSNLDTYRSHVEARQSEDEIELVGRDLSRKSSTSPLDLEEKEGVRVTTDVRVVTHAM